MSQSILIQSANNVGKTANILFNPAGTDITINLENQVLPYLFDAGELNPQREVYGTYTILVIGDDCPYVMNVPQPSTTTTTTLSPDEPGVYFGKFTGETITQDDVIHLDFFYTNKIVNKYVTFPSGEGFGYILVPTGFIQPTKFKNSSNGCYGLNIPTNLIGQIIIIDGNGFPINYNIYKTYNDFLGEIDCWLCN